MRIKDLIKEKNDEKKINETIEIDHLIYGVDTVLLKTFSLLKERYPDQKVQILSNKEIQYEDLYLSMPSTLRGTENISLVKELLSDLELKEVNKISKFYKDQKFKEFGGRSKPGEMFFDEEYFSTPRFEINEEELIGKPEILATLNESRINKYIDSVEMDIEGKIEIHSTDGTKIICKNLYWLDDPESLFKLVKNKTVFGENFIEIATKLRPLRSVAIDLEYSSQINDEESTLLIPHSMSSEQGHFICEFNLEKTQTEGQKLRIFSYLQEEEVAEEQIEKKIRAIFSSMKRIFNFNFREKKNEFIHINEQTPCLIFDDNQKTLKEGDLKNVFFLGSRSPLREFWNQNLSTVYSNKVSGVARSLATFHSLKENILDQN